MKFWIFVFTLFIFSQTTYSQEFGKGLVFNDQQYASLPKKMELSGGVFTTLPDNFSLKPYSPRPGNQMQLNNGPAWAICYAAMGIVEAKFNGIKDPKVISSQFSYSPAFSYSSIKDEDDQLCSVGVSIIDLLTEVSLNGAMRFKDYPALCVDDITEKDQKLAKQNRKFDFLKLFNLSDGDNTKLYSMKEALANGNPIVWGFHAPPSFNSPRVFWQPRETFSKNFPGHAVCIVGYDDKKYGGAFEVLNSWTSNWGNEGYMWVRYTDFLEFGKYAFEVIPMPGALSASFTLQSYLSFVNENGTKINIKKSDSKDGVYKFNDKYHVGTRFYMKLESTGPSYTYVFASDDSKENFLLFPEESVSPLMKNYQNTYLSPQLELEYNAGKDYICIIHSRYPIDIAHLLRELESKDGSFTDRLNGALKLFYPDKQDINWHDSEASFSVSTNNGSVIPLVVEIAH